MYVYVIVKKDLYATDGCINFVQCFIFIRNLHQDVSVPAVLSASVRSSKFNPVRNLT